MLDINYTYTMQMEQDPDLHHLLQVRVAGTDTIALELPGIALTEGKIYNVFAKHF